MNLRVHARTSSCLCAGMRVYLCACACVGVRARVCMNGMRPFVGQCCVVEAQPIFSESPWHDTRTVHAAMQATHEIAHTQGEASLEA